jgi:hypothetical protein
MISAAKKDVTNWTDENKRILILLLMKHSGGNYSYILNDKKKWKAVEVDFNVATGKFD